MQKWSRVALYLPIICLHYLQYPLLHILKWDGLHVGVGRASLFGYRDPEVLHDLLQLEQEVVLELRPLNPGGEWYRQRGLEDPLSNVCIEFLVKVALRMLPPHLVSNVDWMILFV